MTKKNIITKQLCGVLLAMTTLCCCACANEDTQQIQTEPEAVSEQVEEAAPEETEPESSAEETAAEPEEVSEEPDNALFADYMALIQEPGLYGWDGFALIDLDLDGATDLVCTCTDYEFDELMTNNLQPYMIVFSGPDGLEKYEDLRDGVAGAGGYRGNLYYISGTRMVYDCAFYAPFGEPSDSVFLLENGEISVTASGYFDVNDAEVPSEGPIDILEYGDWKWNQEIVTKEQYEQNLDAVLGDYERIPLCELDYMDRDSIIEVLSSKN